MGTRYYGNKLCARLCLLFSLYPLFRVQRARCVSPFSERNSDSMTL